jgi:hypothetical protein
MIIHVTGEESALRKQVTQHRKFNSSGAPLENSVEKSDSSYLELLFHR